MRRPILLPTLFLPALLATPVRAQAFVNLGQPLVEVSATADSRSAGVEGSFTFLVHGALAAYRLKEKPLAGPDTGYRLDLGFGLGNPWRELEALHVSAGYSLVADPDRSRDHRVHGMGFFLRTDVTVAAHILVGVYGELPLAAGQKFGTVGVRVGLRLPPYR